MPDQPLVIFDGSCGFCRIWIEYWKQLTGSKVAYASSQEVGAGFPEIPPESFSQSVQLVMPDGEVISGARAVFVTLTYVPGMAGLLWLYTRVPGFAPLTEACYRFIAAHRSFFYQATRFTFGRRVAPLGYARVEWLLVRVLAIVYFIAFASLAVQITGLVGARGILPAAGYLQGARRALGAEAYSLIPTLLWFAHSDFMLRTLCWTGAAVAVALLFGFLERVALVSLYLLYLSLCSVGQDFLGYQWDGLLLEAGFLAIFLGSSKWMVLLGRWLLFRLMFLSGAVKLASHDVSWADLTAIGFHYLTQPLPTPVAWYMYQLPRSFQRFSTGVALFIEVLVPFLIFAPRLWRLAAAACLLVLQVLIFITGNYAFFNLLAMGLCVFLLDDAWLARFRLPLRRARTKPALVAVVAVLILLLSSSEMVDMFSRRSHEPLSSVARFMAPFEIVNTYGLFGVMTTRRPEILVQGSADGRAWLDYEFPYKPGDLKRAPPWVAPYQPRLDWQMWFAALSGYRGALWFGNFLVRLLEGSPDVAGLLSKNPFPNAPPKYVRALLFDYRFTDWEERRRTGNWWKREWRGFYLRAISLEDVR